jgi:fatty-acyl-CoA synthase
MNFMVVSPGIVKLNERARRGGMDFQPSEQIRQAGLANVGSLFRSRVDAAPERLAITDLQQSLTYADLNQRVNRLANYLSGVGIRHGDRVALLARNCIAYLEVELACAKIGAIVAAQNWRLADRELSHCLNLVTPKIIIHDAALACQFGPLRVGHGQAFGIGSTL